MTLGLGEKVLGLHRMLTEADLPHAFGGALALAFCTREPRATKDIDLNVFIGSERSGSLAAALQPDIELDDAAARVLARDAQARLWWGGTPIDVFLSNHPFHDDVRRRVRQVPFGELEALPVLSCADLAVFKAFFARPKDILDIATMAFADAIDVDELQSSVEGLMGGHVERADLFDKVAQTVADLRGG